MKEIRIREATTNQYGDYAVLLKMENKEEEWKNIINAVKNLMQTANDSEFIDKYIEGTGTIIIRDSHELGDGFFTVGLRFEAEKEANVNGQI